MADPFTDDLAARVHDSAAEVDRVVLPALKQQISTLKVAFESMLDLLKKKGILSDDPYQYNEKISEITPVSTDPIMENQKVTAMAIRMHNFETQVAYLGDYYPWTLDHLTLGRLKAISQFLRFVRWEALSEGHQETNTKVVAEFIGKIRKGDDTISAGLVNDLVHQADTATAKTFDLLKKITVLKREEYKLLVRQSFWPQLNLAPEEVRGNPDNVQKRIRNAFAQHLKGQPFVPELIKELLDEDFAPNAQALREEVHHRLAVRKAAEVKAQAVFDPRAEFMEAARTLSTVNLPLDAALRKLHENLSFLPPPDETFGEKLQSWIRKLLKLPGKPKIFPIELFDPSTGATKRELLEFDTFVAEVQARTRVLGATSIRGGPQFVALSQKQPDEILSWFERQFIDTAKTVERLNGLDLFFKTESVKDKRSQVKGLKAEISQIRTTLGNANKMRHEAVGRQEEQEQLKRLGVK